DNRRVPETHSFPELLLRYGLTKRLELRLGWNYEVGSGNETSGSVGKVPVGERWNVHAEYFGLFSRNKEQEFSKHFISPGAHYLITDDFEVGVRVGWGLNDQSARFFTNAGFGLRF